MSVPDEYRQQSSQIAGTEYRGISVAQLQRLAAFCREVFSGSTCVDENSGHVVEWETASKYNVDTFITKPLTVPFRCSTVELVAEGPQPPMWFVSHAWSHGLQESVEILAYHAEVRQGSDGAEKCYYWICTFANNQHNLGELAGTLEATPFYKAIMMSSCRGTIALICAEAILFSRVWCLFESHVSMAVTHEQGKEHLYDLGVMYSGVRVGPFLLSRGAIIQKDLGGGEFTEVTRGREVLDLPPGGLGAVEPKVVLRPNFELPPGRHHAAHAKRIELAQAKQAHREVLKVNFNISRGPVFPPHVAAAALKADVGSAQASRSEDRDAILHLIAGTLPSARDKRPPECHESYDRLNQRLHTRFAEGIVLGAVGVGAVARLEESLAEFPALLHRPFVCGEEHFTLLGVATAYGHAHVVRSLLAMRAPLDSVDGFGQTALLAGLLCGHTDVVAELVGQRADPHIRSNLNLTAMQVAQFRGSADECASLLLNGPLP